MYVLCGKSLTLRQIGSCCFLYTSEEVAKMEYRRIKYECKVEKLNE